MEDKDFKLLKKHYGEKFAQLCRSKFPTIAETESVYEVISKLFPPTRSLYQDLVKADKVEEFVNYVIDAAQHKDEEKVEEDPNPQSPHEMMRKAGYTLYECKTKADIMRFKKFYSEDEELCTFDDSGKEGRLDTHHVFFAVKDGTTKNGINGKTRDDFTEPQRQDEYGTSVISIQFVRGSKQHVSIKNRYNHTVSNPDATFSNDLNNIIDGLQNSFAKHYNFNLSKTNENSFVLMPYVLANDGRMYRYNTMIEGVCFCENNVVVDVNGNFMQWPKEKYVLADNFLIDLKNKTIQSLANRDALPASVGTIENIDIQNLGENKQIKLTTKENGEVYIVVDNHGSIVEYKNTQVQKLASNFMEHCSSVKSVSIPNVTTIKHNCLRSAAVEHLEAGRVQTMGENCFPEVNMDSISMPELVSMGDDCFALAKVRVVDFPKLKTVGSSCFSETSAEKINLPEVKELPGDNFAYVNELQMVNMPKLEKIGFQCFSEAEAINSLNLPHLKAADDSFLHFADKLETLNLPNLRILGDYYFEHCASLRVLNAPKLHKYGESTFSNNPLFLAQVEKSKGGIFGLF